MARSARIRAESGIYYVLIKSDAAFIEDGPDAEEFLKILGDEKERDFTEIFAYCLFSDEAHIIFKEGLGGVSKNIMRIKSFYAVYKNRKRETSGKLFKDRFSSYPIETPEELLNAVRTLHRLPLKKNLTINYEFSSYPVYFKNGGILSSDAIMLIAGSKIDFQIYNETVHKKTAHTGKRLTDGELIVKIRKLFEGAPPCDFENLDDKGFKNIIVKIKEIDGVTIPQIARVLNVGVEEIDS